MLTSRLLTRLVSFPVLILVVLVSGLFPVQVMQADDNTALDDFRRLFAYLDMDNPLPPEVFDRSRWPNNDLLTSYLELELLQHPRVARPLTVDLRSFVRRWPDHPHGGKIQRMLDERIADEGTDAEVLAWFDRRPLPAVASQQKRYLEVLLANQRQEDAWRIWRDYYRNGYDISDALDLATQVISRQLTAEDHETRARTVIQKGKANALPGVLRQIRNLDLRNYFLTLAVARSDSRQFETMVAKLPQQMAQSSELWFERVEYYRRQGAYSQAAALLQGPKGKLLNPEDSQRARYRLAKDMVYPGKDYKNAWLVLQPSSKLKNPKMSDTFWLAGWCAYKLGNRPAALEMFKRLAEEGDDLRMRSQGGIWAAVLIGIAKPEATPWLEIAGRYPESFYGFLGAEMTHPDSILPREPAEQPCGPLLERQDLQTGLNRMTILKTIGRSFHNGLEVQALAEKFGLNPSEQICLATAYGDPNHAIQVASPLYYKQGIRLWNGLYPLPSWKPDTGWILDPALVWGTSRQESLFSPAVVSRSGALGLLQLMPATAREEAQLLKMEASTPHRLRQPGYNLSLGQSYLFRMLKRFDGDLVLALISYNAGPSRAQNWRPERTLKDALNFIEDIPIHETRDYVKKVTHGYAVYHHLMYGKGSVLKVISPGKPGVQYLAAPATP
ncbi:MAG: lytic transglycosylase domain-containing protein [Magnetococcales bacterium]|nr:lytic transglycosylase domain-containing protein [Magnetococcales bacterium]